MLVDNSLAASRQNCHPNRRKKSITHGVCCQNVSQAILLPSSSPRLLTGCRSILAILDGEDIFVSKCPPFQSKATYIQQQNKSEFFNSKIFLSLTDYEQVGQDTRLNPVSVGVGSVLSPEWLVREDTTEYLKEEENRST